MINSWSRRRKIICGFIIWEADWPLFYTKQKTSTSGRLTGFLPIPNRKHPQMGGWLASSLYQTENLHSWEADWANILENRILWTPIFAGTGPKPGFLCKVCSQHTSNTGTVYQIVRERKGRESEEYKRGENIEKKRQETGERLNGIELNGRTRRARDV